MVIVKEDDAVPDIGLTAGGLNEQLAPMGRLLQVNEILPENPGEAVSPRTTSADIPFFTERKVGDAETVKRLPATTV